VVTVSAGIGAIATGAVLGITHTIEPDHVAGVASLSGRTHDRRRSALIGTCFALGHVVLILAWLLVGYAIHGRTAFGSVFDVVGTLGVAILLGLLGATMTVGGLRSFVHRHAHVHDDDTQAGDAHTHYHVYLPFVGDSVHRHGDARPEPADSRSHVHDHTVRHYLSTGVFGALFTLSPPLSMIAFTATVLPAHGPAAVGVAIAAYTVGIAVTMGALGAGVGTIAEVTAERPSLYSLVRTVAGLLVLAVAVTVALG